MIIAIGPIPPISRRPVTMSVITPAGSNAITSLPIPRPGNGIMYMERIITAYSGAIPVDHGMTSRVDIAMVHGSMSIG